MSADIVTSTSTSIPSTIHSHTTPQRIEPISLSNPVKEPADIEDLYADIAQLEFVKKMYEPDIAFYQKKISEYEEYLSLFGGRYWEDDTVHRDEAQKRHEIYIETKNSMPELIENYARIVADLSANYEKLAEISP